MTTSKTVIEFADQLRQYAEHFEQRDWDYTRHHDIKRIVYRARRGDYDHWWERVKRAVREVARIRKSSLDRILPVPRWSMARAHLRGDDHLPDGILDGGAIIAHWEETGEYLQYVQPSVGSMLADWMEAEPESPYALRIAGEMKRINDAYGERIERENA